MRERDQPRLHTRHCVWIGLIIAVAVRPALSAQDAAGVGPGVRVQADPIELSARRVQYWDGPGERWAVLSGEAAVLQGAEGLRRPGCRRPDRRRSRKTAPGPFRSKSTPRETSGSRGRDQSPRRSHREVLATRKGVKLSSYKEDGTERLPSPPVGLKILERSGLAPSVPAVAARGANVPAPGERGRRRLAALAGSGAGPRCSAGAARSRTEAGAVRSPGPAAGPRAGAGRRRTRACPGAAPADGAAQDGPAADRGRAGRRGAEPDNPDDVPRAEPLPGPPRISLRRPCGVPSRGTGPARARRRAADRPRSWPGSQRITSIFPRSGRKVDIQFHEAARRHDHR